MAADGRGYGRYAAARGRLAGPYGGTNWTANVGGRGRSFRAVMAWKDRRAHGWRGPGWAWAGYRGSEDDVRTVLFDVA